MDSYDNIQPLIGRRFILPFIILFFANILLICYELNTGIEHILNEKNRSFIFKLVFSTTQSLNSWIIAFVALPIGFYIASHIKASGFIVILSIFVTFFVILFACVGICGLSMSTISFGAQLSADSRLQIQCTVLLVTQIGLFVLYYIRPKYVLT